MSHRSYKQLFLCCAALVMNIAQGVTLAEHKQTNYQILVPAQSMETTKNAAKELQIFLQRSTGADFKITATVSINKKYIAVGPLAAKKLFGDVNLSLKEMGQDGILIDVREDGNILLTGAEGASRGTLNAVYTFLEDYVGYRWWTPTAMKVPQHVALEIQPFCKRYIPPFSYREVGDPIAREGYYAVRNRMNGFFTNRPKGEWGKKILYGDGNHLEHCHTFYHHVPPKQYFKLHPEWYAYSKAAQKRIALEGNGIPGQLCLSNPELLEFYKKRVRKLLERSPKETIVSVSQMDNCGPCQCDACIAIDAQEGAPSGKLIRFVNAIADDIKDDYPQAKIDTLAYTHNRKAPKTAPRANVIVRLCSIECSYNHPFSHPDNADFMNDLKAWYALGTNLHVWDYSVNFANYLMPHPGLRVLGENMEILAKNGVQGVFMLGCHSSRNGEFSALRSWVTAKLLWNPYLNTQDLIHEFCTNYYGSSGEKILEYIALLERSLDSSTEKLTVFNHSCNTAYTKPEVLHQAEELFKEAFQMAGKDTILQGRLQQAKMPLLFAIVNTYQDYAKYLKKMNLPVTERSQYFSEMESIHKKFPVGQVREGASFAVWLKDNRNFIRKQTSLPTPLIGSQEYKEIQDDKFSLGKSIADPAASDGGAAIMKAAKKQNWLIQLNRFPIDGKTYKIFAEVRVQFNDPNSKDIYFGWGVYDQNKRRSLLYSKVTVKQDKNGKYELYYLGENQFNAGQYLWFSQSPDASLFVDRIILVRK